MLFCSFIRLINVDRKIIYIDSNRCYERNHLNFCRVEMHKSHLIQLQILQNRSLRVVMNVDYMFPTTLLYETLKLDRLQIRWSKLARTMYRAIHELCPPYLSSIFSFREAVYCTRYGSHVLKLIQPKTNYGKRSLTYRGAKLWNELDYPLSIPASIDICKRHLNGHPNLMNRITIIFV